MAGDTTSSCIKAGGAGGILLIPAIFMNIILTIVGLVAPTSIYVLGTTILQTWYVVVQGIACVIFGIGVLLLSLGTYGLWKLYNNAFPLVVGIIGIVVTAFWYLVMPISVVNLQIGIIISAIAIILAGVFFVLLGIAFILLQEKTGSSELSLATGILSTIAGIISLVGGGAIFANNVIIAAVGFVILIPAAICAALIFFKLLR